MSDIYDEFRNFEESMSKIFEELTGIPMGRRLLMPGDRPLVKSGGRRFFPDVRKPFIDIVETDKEIVATAEMPGLEKDEININITEDRLEIIAEKKQEEEQQEKNYVYKERRSQSYHRSISLPALVDINNTKASYNNGVLEIRMPKTETKKKTLIKVE